LFRFCACQRGWIPTAASVPTAFGRFTRQQQTFAWSTLPDRVPDLVQIAVLSCPFYGVTRNGLDQTVSI
jgi:hypothetical protein